MTTERAMTTADAGAAPIPRWGRWTPVVNVVAILVVAAALWWLLADPDWGIFGESPQAVGAVLFWVILAHIFTGFIFETWPFVKLSQPWAGVAQVAADVVIGLVAVWLFTYVVGSWDPTFSHDTPGGAGYTAAAFIVLIGFYAFTLVAASWGGYPFENLTQPQAGVGRFFVGAFITLVGVLVLVYPNFNAQLAPNAPVSLPTVLGWVYSSIVIVIVGAMLWQNWPWSLLKNRHASALCAVLVTTVGGYGLFLVLKVVVEVVVPQGVQDLPTFSSSVEAAQLGVCFSLWALIWGLIAGAPPNGSSNAVNRLVRTAIVAGAAILTYVVFMRWLGTGVFHFAAIDDANYGGDPLTWMDWAILGVIWFAVAFGGWFGQRHVHKTA